MSAGIAPASEAALSRRDLLVLAAATPATVQPFAAWAQRRDDERADGDDGAPVRVSLDGTWRFRTDPYVAGDDAGWFAPGADLAAWTDMPVPGVWDVNADLAAYAGVALYRRTFQTAPEWAGKLVRLCFEGVYDTARVWLNGRAIGGNDIGYLPFHIDLADLVPAGASNHLVVSVDNRARSGAVWNWGGIRRPVWLEVTDPTRLEEVRITADPDLATGLAKVIVRARARRHAGGAMPRAEVVLRRAGAVVWRSALLAGAAADGHDDFRCEADLAPGDVHLWSPDRPALYHAEVRLIRAGGMIGSRTQRFGIRRVEVAGDRLLLNGEPVRALGFNLVPEDRRTGSTLPPSRFRADVDLMRMLGARLSRLSHSPLPPDFLDYMDEVGLMCVSEVPIWGKSPLVDAASPVAADWLERLIATQFNHPCVIGWSVGNEIGRFDRNPGARAYVRRAIARAKALDPRRIATYASNSAPTQADDPATFADLILLNAYGDIRETIGKTRALHPGKPIFLSEYGDGLDGEDPDAARITGDTFLKELRGLPYVIGGAQWTFADYRSNWPGWPFSPPTAPSQNRSWGVVTVDRRPKRSFRSVRAGNAPVAAMALSESGGAWAAVLTPRATDDLPAAELRGYRLAWRALDRAGAATAGGLLDLPTIAPGGARVGRALPVGAAFATLTVDLIDPLGYSVLTATHDRTPPAAPGRPRISASGKTIRAEADLPPRAQELVLVCRGPGGERRSTRSIDGFLEVDGLTAGARYSVRLVALNGAGESAPGPDVEVSLGSDDLPPILWAVEPDDGALVLHYSTEATDDLFDVEVTRTATGIRKVVSVSTRGAARIPGLENGQDHAVRIRRRNGLGWIGMWSPPRTGRPIGRGGLPAPAEASLVGGTGRTALLTFAPIQHAACYELRVGGRTITILRAASGTALVEGVPPGAPATLRAVDDWGVAGAASTVTRV